MQHTVPSTADCEPTGPLFTIGMCQPPPIPALMAKQAAALTHDAATRTGRHLLHREEREEVGRAQPGEMQRSRGSTAAATKRGTRYIYWAKWS